MMEQILKEELKEVSRGSHKKQLRSKKFFSKCKEVEITFIYIIQD